MTSRLRYHVRRGLRRAANLSVALGLHSRRTGYRAVKECSPVAYFQRSARRGESLEPIHDAQRFKNDLPFNITDRSSLPDDAGWWGYSFRDVPNRLSEATRLATLRDATVVVARDPARGDDFYPAILSACGHALRFREVRWRPIHRDVLRSHRAQRIERPSAWFLERVYDNHSHWLTAHIPKLQLLGERRLNTPQALVLPQKRSPVIDATFDALDIQPAMHLAVDVGVYTFASLTVVQSDRFRPELLRRVSAAFGPEPQTRSDRRLYISRSEAPRRRLRNEDAVWPRLASLGLERVVLETLPFRE